MSHFLSNDRGQWFTLRRTFASVIVRRRGAKGRVQLEVVVEPIRLLKEGTKLQMLPDNIQVTVNGEVVQPNGKFFVTVETIDPSHALCDISDLTVLQ